MGYTNYWLHPKGDEILTTAFVAAGEDCRRVLQATLFQPGGWGDEPVQLRDIEITRDVIAFDGVPDCETFWFDRVIPADDVSRRITQRDDGKLFKFCKTNRHGYDLAVKACLLVLKLRLGIEISSDGREGDADGKPIGWENWTAARWTQASEIVRATLNIPQINGLPGPVLSLE